MMTKAKTRPLIVAGIVVLILAILGVLIWAIFPRQVSEPAAEPENLPLPTPEVVIREKEVEKIVEVEKTVTAAMLRDGLRDVGVLVTQEYCFTQVISHSTMLSLNLDFKFFRINEPLPVTESSFLASFDGVVTAGIDFGGIEVDKDDEARTVTVTLPEARILTVDIDPDSFQLYDERQGLGTRITVDDYNNAMLRLEETAADKAIARGVLERADENARIVVRNFILGFLEGEGYAVFFADTPETTGGN